MNEATSYIRRETRVSIAVNAVLSLAFYVLFFGTSRRAAIGGIGGLSFDFIPQSFAITLMSTLVPGLLTMGKLARGQLTPQPGQSPLPRSLLLRSLLLAAGAALAGAVVALMVTLGWGSSTLAWHTGAGIKILYGALLAWIVTPFGLRATLQYGERAGVARSSGQ
ncbi:MAG: hypothetical protein ABIS51_17155 [Sphingomonas sp.]